VEATIDITWTSPLEQSITDRFVVPMFRPGSYAGFDDDIMSSAGAARIAMRQIKSDKSMTVLFVPHVVNPPPKSSSWFGQLNPNTNQPDKPHGQYDFLLINRLAKAYSQNETLHLVTLTIRDGRQLVAVANLFSVSMINFNQFFLGKEITFAAESTFYHDP
jgi:hypothetical protein